jgi:hypothetical protein
LYTLNKLFCWAAISGVICSGCVTNIQAELQKAEHRGKPIFIAALGPTKPDKHGLAAARAQFFNTSDRVYKYVDITVEAYNRVGDAIYHRGQTVSKLRFTGPLQPRRSSGPTLWPAIWQDAAISCLLMKRVDVTYMDGTLVTIEGPALRPVIAPGLNSPCPSA